MTSLVDTQFDPYREWLQIAGTRRPPTHYELLGLPAFESDGDRVRQAALDRTVLVRRFQTGRHSDVAIRLLGELSQALVCLTDPRQKQEYDRRLAGGQGATGGVKTQAEGAPAAKAASMMTPTMAILETAEAEIVLGPTVLAETGGVETVIAEAAELRVGHIPEGQFPGLLASPGVEFRLKVDCLVAFALKERRLPEGCDVLWSGQVRQAAGATGPDELLAAVLAKLVDGLIVQLYERASSARRVAMLLALAKSPPRQRLARLLIPRLDDAALQGLLQNYRRELTTLYPRLDPKAVNPPHDAALAARLQAILVQHLAAPHDAARHEVLTLWTACFDDPKSATSLLSEAVRKSGALKPSPSPGTSAAGDGHTAGATAPHPSPPGRGSEAASGDFDEALSSAFAKFGRMLATQRAALVAFVAGTLFGGTLVWMLLPARSGLPTSEVATVGGINADELSSNDADKTTSHDIDIGMEIAEDTNGVIAAQQALAAERAQAEAAGSLFAIAHFGHSLRFTPIVPLGPAETGFDEKLTLVADAAIGTTMLLHGLDAASPTGNATVPGNSAPSAPTPSGLVLTAAARPGQPSALDVQLAGGTGLTVCSFSLVGSKLELLWNAAVPLADRIAYRQRLSLCVLELQQFNQNRLLVLASPVVDANPLSTEDGKIKSGPKGPRVGGFSLIQRIKDADLVLGGGNVQPLGAATPFELRRDRQATDLTAPVLSTAWATHLKAASAGVRLAKQNGSWGLQYAMRRKSLAELSPDLTDRQTNLKAERAGVAAALAECRAYFAGESKVDASNKLADHIGVQRIPPPDLASVNRNANFVAYQRDVDEKIIKPAAARLAALDAELKTVNTSLVAAQDAENQRIGAELKKSAQWSLVVYRVVGGKIPVPAVILGEP